MSSAERVLVNESTVPDPGNAGVGKIFYFPPPMEVFFMGNEEKRTNPIVDFFRKNMWVLTVIFAVCAILITFLPVLKYEIRETVYDSATGDRLFKTDYTYRMNLISYFSTGFTYNFSFFITIGMVAIGGILAFVGKFKKELTTISGIFFLLALCFFILSKEFFSAEGNNIMDNAKIVGTVYDEATQTFDASFHGAYLSWGSAFAITFCALAFSTTNFGTIRHTTKEIAEEGVLISLAFVLNFIKIPVGVSGGSINFQMLPLMIIALRHGPAHGLIAGGIVYGLLTCLTDGYGFVCYPFDYLIGFGSVAVMGLFNKLIFGKGQKRYNFLGLLFIFVGGVLSTLVRYVGSNLSSIVVYGLTLKEALIYNSIYIPLSGLISIVAIMVLYQPLIMINKRFPARYNHEQEEATQ